MSVPRLNAVVCGPKPTPPYTAATRTSVCLARPTRCSVICTANSRVGARMSARVFPRGSCMSELIIGNPNAADFPLPVWALARISRPSIAGGIACSCTGVGSVNPKSRTARSSAGARPSSSKLVMFAIFLIVGAARSSRPIDRAGEDRSISRMSRSRQTEKSLAEGADRPDGILWRHLADIHCRGTGRRRLPKNVEALVFFDDGESTAKLDGLCAAHAAAGCRSTRLMGPIREGRADRTLEGESKLSGEKTALFDDGVLR